MTHKRFDRCILHIGTEKTGSSAIQQYLIENRKSLRRHRVLFPYDESYQSSSQWEYVAAVHDAPWKQDIGRNLNIGDTTQQNEFASKLADELENKARGTRKTETLLISSEHFQSRLLDTEAIQRLKDFLDPWVSNFQIIVYFRRQDQLALSFLSTHLKSNRPLNSENILSLMGNPPHYFNYLKIFEHWAGVFGERSINARIYAPQHWKNNNLLEDFSSACSLPLLKLHEDRSNASLNQQGFHFLQAVNDQFPQTPGDRSDPVRHEIVKRIARLCAGKYYPISRSQAIQFYDQFKGLNERLRSKAFPNHAAPLFDPDFSEYPEQPDSLTPDYSDAVDLAVKLFNDLDSSPASSKRILKTVSRRLLQRIPRLGAP